MKKLVLNGYLEVTLDQFIEGYTTQGPSAFVPENPPVFEDEFTPPNVDVEYQITDDDITALNNMEVGDLLEIGKFQIRRIE